MNFKKGMLALGALVGLQCSVSMAGEIPTGAHAAQAEAYPWMAAIVKRSVSSAYEGVVCEGTVIDKKWVLTSANCIIDWALTATDMDVVVGRSNLTSTAGARVHVAEVIQYPKYDNSAGANDLALLRLSTAVNVEPVEVVLPNLYRTLVTDGTPMRVIGWGTSSPTTSWRGDPMWSTTWSSKVLMEYDLQRVSNQQRCPNGGPGLDSMCAGVSGSNTDINACFGDAGHPLLIRNGGKWALAGVSSLRIGCSGRGISATYAGTANALNWINQVMKGSASCGATSLYRYFNPFIGDTYLSPQVFDGAFGYGFKDKIGKICTTKPFLTTLVPLYELWKPQTDHLYTRENIPNGTFGYDNKLVLGYVYPSAASTRKPLCRYYNATITDHFYDAPDDGVCKDFTSTGYVLEKTEGYILK